MEQILRLLLQEIDRCYHLAGLDLLEAERLQALEAKIKTDLSEVTKTLDDEILSLTYKKMTSGWTTQLKPGFHNISTAHSRLEVWRIFITEILAYFKSSSRTLKNRLDAEGLFIESRSKKEGDLHILIGRRDGKAEKAHVTVDEKTAEIRVEDNQIEPLEIVAKIESIVTLPNGKKIRVTREAIEELVDE